MRRDQKGFTALEGLLILVILGTIGFVGWYVYNAKTKTNKLLSATANISTSAATNLKTTNNKSAMPESSQSTTPSQKATITTPALRLVKEDGTPAKFTWNPISRATSYQLCWTGDSSGCTTVYGANATTASPTTSLVVGKSYSAKVTADDPNHTVSNTVNWQEGATNATATALTLTLLDHTASGASFSWDAIAGAITYTLCWTGDGSGCTTVTGTNAAVPASSPLFAGDHYSAKLTADDPNHTISNTVSWQELAPVYTSQ